MYPFDVKMINAYCEVEKWAFLFITNFNHALLNYITSTSPYIKTSDKHEHKQGSPPTQELQPKFSITTIYFQLKEIIIC